MCRESIQDDVLYKFSARRPQNEYNAIEKAKLAYKKQHKYTRKQTRKMILRQLALLEKILGKIRRQMRIHPNEELLKDKRLGMLDTIIRVYSQQKNNFKSGDSPKNIPNKIVSVSKPYIRPKVRYKQTKREIARVRETAMAGSFGIQKEDYRQRKVRNEDKKSTDVILTLFCILTANVVSLAR